MSSIKVAVRCRPLFDGERPVSGLDVQNRRILLDNKAYDPDYTFAPTSNQDDVFQICKPILDAVKEGGGLNGTIMVYGQTGTGKTYTMLGNEGRDNGLVHKVIGSMLEHVQTKTMSGSECALTLSMIEIYNEKLTDMLSPNGSEEVTLIGGFPRFTQKVALCRLEDANQAVTQGLSWRRTAATMMNERSSRSHVVFIVDYEEVNPYTNETDVSHLFLVDLAGSESLKKSQAIGATASEAGKINRSLLALKNVFLALSNTNEANRPSHVPYRDSRLTELLQDSIGGTARTLLIACISAVGRDLEETKSTLMYAVKARSIRNATNSEREKLLLRLRSIEVENQRLRNRLEDRVAERGGYTVSKEEHVRYQQLEVEVEELRASVGQLVKDSQTINARQHILETKAKLVQAALEEKEAELQQFKQTYQEAMRKFEDESRQLQRAVQNAVGAAKHTAQHLSEAQYAVLEGWRKALEVAAGQPPGTSTGTGGNFSSSLPLCSGSATGEENAQAAATPKRGRAAPAAVNEESEGGETTAINSPNPHHPPIMGMGSSPSRRSPGIPPCTHYGPLLSHSRTTSLERSTPSVGPCPPLRAGPLFASQKNEEEEEEAELEEPYLVNRPNTRPSITASTMVQRPVPLVLPNTAAEALVEADATCERVLGRVYGAFHDILQTLLREKTAFQDRLHQLQEERRHKVAEVTDELQRHVTESVQKLFAADALHERETTRAEETLASEWSATVGPSFSATTSLSSSAASASAAPAPSRAALHALQHVARDVCHTISRSALSTFPASPDPPAELVAALQKISLTGEQQITQSTGRQLGPLASLGPLLAAGGPSIPPSPRVSDASTAASSAHGGGSASGSSTSFSSTRTTTTGGSVGAHNNNPNTHLVSALSGDVGRSTTVNMTMTAATRASTTARRKAGPPSSQGAANQRGRVATASSQHGATSARSAPVSSRGNNNNNNNSSSSNGSSGANTHRTLSRVGPASVRERTSRVTGTNATAIPSRRSLTPVGANSSRHRGGAANAALGGAGLSPTAPGSKRRRSELDASNSSLHLSPGSRSAILSCGSQSNLVLSPGPAPARARRRGHPSATPVSDTERLSAQPTPPLSCLPLSPLCGNTTTLTASNGLCEDADAIPRRRSPSPTPSLSSAGGRRGNGPANRIPMSRKNPHT